MKTYTRNQIEAIMLRGYYRGLEDGRQPKDRQVGMKPPTLEELEIDVPRTSSDDPANMAAKRPWLEGVPRGVPR